MERSIAEYKSVPKEASKYREVVIEKPLGPIPFEMLPPGATQGTVSNQFHCIYNSVMLTTLVKAEPEPVHSWEERLAALEKFLSNIPDTAR